MPISPICRRETDRIHIERDKGIKVWIKTDMLRMGKKMRVARVSLGVGSIVDSGKIRIKSD